MGERTQETNDAAQSKIEKALGDARAGSKQVSSVVLTSMMEEMGAK